MAIYFISDPHFGHQNVIRYCQRPFSGIAEMERVLIENYNTIVSPNDTVYFMGDIFFCGVTRAKETIKKLNGYKILIRGNHDRSIEKMKEIGFDEVYDKLELDIEGVHVKMCHFPYRPFTGDIPQFVLDEIEKAKLEMRKTGQDTRSRIDSVLDNYTASGAITQAQGERLKTYDMRFFERRYEDQGSWLLCGHIHEHWLKKKRMINVGVDVWDFKPVSVEQILKIMSDTREDIKHCRDL